MRIKSYIAVSFILLSYALRFFSGSLLRVGQEVLCTTVYRYFWVLFRIQYVSDIFDAC